MIYRLKQAADFGIRPFAHIDWFLFAAALAIALLGLVTMHSFASDQDVFFDKQIVWVAVAVVVFFIASIPEYTFLRRTPVVVGVYSVVVVLLATVFIFGAVVKGAQSRFDLGLFRGTALRLGTTRAHHRLGEILCALKHVEIAHIRHILVSGGYAFLITLLVFLQPDFGGAIIIAAMWLGMTLVAGISFKHLAALFLTGAILAGGLWNLGLEQYQKQRILTFLHPLADIQGAGYNAYQSTVAIGSGGLTGKGIGFGTQSKLRFLPEYQTDFIFAAYAEEWGFIGIVLLFGLYALVILRTLAIAAHGSDNFAVLFGTGVTIMFASHFAVHVGMNMGLLPVTGTTTPFMSYGGSHVVTEFLALGILMGMRRHARPLPSARDRTELVGAV